MNKKILALACALSVALPARADLSDITSNKWFKLGTHFATNGGEALGFFWVARKALKAWAKEQNAGDTVKALATLSDHKYLPGNKLVAVGAALALANYGWTTFKAGKDIYNEVDKEVDAKDILAAAQKIAGAAGEGVIKLADVSADGLAKLGAIGGAMGQAALKEATRRKDVEATRSKLAADKNKPC